jgi:hypothetical protein
MCSEMDAGSEILPMDRQSVQAKVDPVKVVSQPIGKFCQPADKGARYGN